MVTCRAQFTHISDSGNSDLVKKEKFRGKGGYTSEELGFSAGMCGKQKKTKKERSYPESNRGYQNARGYFQNLVS